MQYLILIYSQEAEMASATPEESQHVMGQYRAYSAALQAEGVVVGANALQPTATARSVRVRDGQRVVTDGPFAETREQLGGYYLVDCASEEQALDAAARCPGAQYGIVELRPIWDFPDAD